VAEDQLLLVLDGVDLAWFADRYKMFLMLDDIEVDEVEDATLLTLQGPSTDGVLAIVGLPLPATPHAHLIHDGVRILRKDRTGLGGVDLIVPTGALEDWRGRLLDAGAHTLDAATLDALRILAKQVSWPRDGSDKSMVHELALNEECCNFTKGCYVGQEVINRIDVKGQVQKRLTQVRLDGPLPELPAEVVLEGATVGRLTSGAHLGDHAVAIGVIRKKAWAPGTAVDVAGSPAEVT
jgi:folate-binding protein YgfZ